MNTKKKSENTAQHTVVFDGNKVIWEYQTWGDFLDDAKNKDIKTHDSDFQSIKGGAHFTGTKNFDQAMNLALNGWPEGEGKALELASNLFDRVSSLIDKTKIVYDVTGMSIDMGAYLNGEPECWQRQETEIGEGVGKKHLRIVYNHAASCGVDKHVIHARGAAVAALIQLLEFADRRVELWSACGLSNRFRNNQAEGCEYRVLVKRADQDLDMGRVIFSVAHSSMLRRLGFGVMESIPEFKDQVEMCYGYPSEVLGNRGDIYLGEMMYGETWWTDPERAEKWVIEELKKQGIHLINEGEQ